MTDLLSTGQAAALKRVDRHTIRNWIEFRGLPALRLGRNWFVERADVEAFERPLAGRKPKVREEEE